MTKHYFDTRRVRTERSASTPASDRPGSAPAQRSPPKSGSIAERLEALAREHGLPVYEDFGLVEALARLEAGRLIPPELYDVVAEVLAFVYAVDAALARR